MQTQPHSDRFGRDGLTIKRFQLDFNIMVYERIAGHSASSELVFRGDHRQNFFPGISNHLLIAQTAAHQEGFLWPGLHNQALDLDNIPEGSDWVLYHSQWHWQLVDKVVGFVVSVITTTKLVANSQEHFRGTTAQ